MCFLLLKHRKKYETSNYMVKSYEVNRSLLKYYIKLMEVISSKVEAGLSTHDISLSVLFAIWLILGLATYAFALFTIWLPEIESLTII